MTSYQSPTRYVHVKGKELALNSDPLRNTAIFKTEEVENGATKRNEGDKVRRQLLKASITNTRMFGELK